MRKTLKLLLAAGLFSLLLGQEPLTNESVIKMKKAGLSDDVVVGVIKAQPAKFSLSADGLIALKSSGVSDQVIAAMVAKGSGGGSVVDPAPPSPEAAAKPVSEIGVYYKKGDSWAELPPEVVNFKTGGVIKSIGSAGLVKGDVNGHVNGAHSTNQVKTPVEFLIYAPEGVSVTEYQLLRLREQHDSREFRTVTGGVLHVSGGATRDLVPFESKKIAPRTYTIVAPNLGGGEYGFLPPSSSDSSGSTGRAGKIYSFRILE